MNPDSPVGLWRWVGSWGPGVGGGDSPSRLRIPSWNMSLCRTLEPCESMYTIMETPHNVQMEMGWGRKQGTSLFGAQFEHSTLNPGCMPFPILRTAPALASSCGGLRGDRRWDVL